MVYGALMLIVGFHIIATCNSYIAERIHYTDWWRQTVILLFLLLIAASVTAYHERRKRKRCSLRPGVFFWIGWILCFGGVIVGLFFHRAADGYMIWTGLSLIAFPIMWILWSARRGGLESLAEITAKAMVAGSLIYVSMCDVLPLFIPRDPKFNLEEFVGFGAHPNSTGIICSGFAVAALYLLLTSKGYKPLYACSLGLSLSVILAANCRSAQLGLLLAIVFGGVYFLRRRGLPDRRVMGKGILCVLLTAGVFLASFSLLGYVDQRSAGADSAPAPVAAEQTDSSASMEQTGSPADASSEHGSLYDRINVISSDRLTIWSVFVPRIKPLGNGRTGGPLTEANPASYSAHNNVIEVFYVSGYIAGIGMIIWLLYCLYYIGRNLLGRGVFRPHVLFFIMSFMAYLSIMMLDVMMYTYSRPIALMTFLSMGAVAFSRRSEGTGYLTIKRLLDILAGVIGCAVLLPVAAVVKILQIKTGDRGKLFYTQTRIGLKGRPFKIYKFRTMVTGAEEILEELLNEKGYKEQWEDAQKLEDDPRVTRLGRILRKTSIDELPQMLNVLKGNMSIVGPRPLVPGELEDHGGSPLYQKAKPGMTGWWISHGHQNEDYRKRLELEYHYVLNRCLWMDGICLLKTCAYVMGRKGAAEKEAEPVSFDRAPDSTVTVIVPVLNGEKELPALLGSLHRQSRRADEIIVMDSSSTDRTREICADDPQVTLLKIPREDFNHGDSRDLAAGKSSGDILVFLTQDALPRDRDFLDSLIAPLTMEKVAVSTGRQISGRNASPAERLVREYNYPDRSFLRTEKDLDRMGIKTFFVSNVCAAYRKEIYETLGGFERVETNEDMFFAAKAVRAGYGIAYNADAGVYHSHDLSWSEQYERNRIQGREMKRHAQLLGDLPIEAEGRKMVNYVLKGLLEEGRPVSAAGFILDCSARYLGSRAGRRQVK